MERLGITGVDVHKPNKPCIPEMGGLPIFFGFIICSTAIMFIYPSTAKAFLAFILVVSIAVSIGVIDVLRPWGPVSKIIFVAIASLPILIFGTYHPYPALPFIGELRLTFIYPVLFIPIFITLLANATNMMDVLNGSMAGTSAVSSAFLFLIAVLFNRYEAAVMYAMLGGCIFAFYRYNKYPAKVFSGDAGSLGVGAAFAAAAIIGRMEIVTLIALIPAMINGSLILSTVGRLFEHRDLKVRPTSVTENGRIVSNMNKLAPITLTRFLTASSPLKEYEVVRCFIVLHVLTGVLAIVTAFWVN